jgi:hypothetical protein
MITMRYFSIISMGDESINEKMASFCSNPCSKSLGTTYLFKFRLLISHWRESKIVGQHERFMFFLNIYSDSFSDFSLVHCGQIFEGTKNDVCTEFFMQPIFLV